MPQCESGLSVGRQITKLYKTVEKRTPNRLTSQATAVLDGKCHGPG
jgi:hypothetical protein